MNKFAGTVITEMDNRALLKIITARDGATQLSVIERLKNKLGVIIPQPTFSNKIKRNGLKISELQKICKLYGYDLLLCQKDYN